MGNKVGDKVGDKAREETRPHPCRGKISQITLNRLGDKVEDNEGDKARGGDKATSMS